MAIGEAVMPIRVVLIDDDADFLWLIRFSLQLEHDITVVGEATRARPVWRWLFDNNPILW
jgi:DNA-binding NarL/FixJ family response regulator